MRRAKLVPNQRRKLDAGLLRLSAATLDYAVLVTRRTAQNRSRCPPGHLVGVSSMRSAAHARAMASSTSITFLMKDLVFLFGAGASYGAGGVLPEQPPLGGQSFSVLTRLFPGSLRLGVEPVSRDRAQALMAEWSDAIAASAEPPGK